MNKFHDSRNSWAARNSNELQIFSWGAHFQETWKEFSYQDLWLGKPLTPNWKPCVVRDWWPSIQKKLSFVFPLSKSPNVIAENLHALTIFPFSFRVTPFVFPRITYHQMFEKLRFSSEGPHFLQSRNVQKLVRFCECQQCFQKQNRQIKFLIECLLVGHFWFAIFLNVLFECLCVGHFWCKLFLFWSFSFAECVLQKFTKETVQLKAKLRSFCFL